MWQGFSIRSVSTIYTIEGSMVECGSGVACTVHDNEMSKNKRVCTIFGRICKIVITICIRVYHIGYMVLIITGVEEKETSVN